MKLFRRFLLLSFLLVLVMSFIGLFLSESDETSEETTSISSETTEEVTGLPGLVAADLKINLERQGLTCSGPRKEETTVSWLCQGQDSDGVRYRAEFLGHPVCCIDYVTATVMAGGADNQVATNFLGFIATSPYDGAEPERSRAWVEENIGGDLETEIGPAMLRLSGPEDAPSVSLAAVDSRWMR